MNLITFTVLFVLNNSDSMLFEFQAEEGMTWEEWISSEYNTVGVYSDENGLVLKNNNDAGYIANMDSFEYVVTTELIVENQEYFTYPIPDD